MVINRMTRAQLEKENTIQNTNKAAFSEGTHIEKAKPVYIEVKFDNGQPLNLNFEP